VPKNVRPQVVLTTPLFCGMLNLGAVGELFSLTTASKVCGAVPFSIANE